MQKYFDRVTFENSPAWTTHINFSEQVTIRNLTLKSIGHNTDALLSCNKMFCWKIQPDTGDDGICRKRRG
jgi:DNA sulfur modification protein DndE